VKAVLCLAILLAGCGGEEAGIVLLLSAASPQDFDRVELEVAAAAELDGPLCAPALVGIDDPGCLPVSIAVVPGDVYGALLVARAIGLDAAGAEVARAEVATRFADDAVLDARLALDPPCYGDDDPPPECRNEVARSLLDEGAPPEAPPCVEPAETLSPAECQSAS
jgi:hypothetical protein